MKITKLTKGEYQTTLPNGMEVYIVNKRQMDEAWDSEPEHWAAYFDEDVEFFRTKRESVEYLTWLVANNEQYQAA
jgi:hypothetical protein